MLTLLACVALGWAGGDGEEISRSRGKKGGVVVLWPRAVGPAEESMAELAGQVQQRLAAAAARVAPAAPVDVRPAPERVCGQLGCRSVAVGVMLAHQAGGCALVGTVSAPGASVQQLVPLLGQVQLAAPAAGFRQGPEQLVTVTEFVPCADVIGQLDTTALEGAVRAALAAP